MPRLRRSNPKTKHQAIKVRKVTVIFKMTVTYTDDLIQTRRLRLQPPSIVFRLYLCFLNNHDLS
jgi:hypothetical protein